LVFVLTAEFETLSSSLHACVDRRQPVVLYSSKKQVQTRRMPLKVHGFIEEFDFGLV
jgi:hypothetical protein